MQYPIIPCKDIKTSIVIELSYEIMGTDFRFEFE